MRGRWRWVGLAAGLLVAGLVAWGVWFVRNPLEALAKQRRSALGKAGFERQVVGSGEQAVTVFVAGSGTPLVFLHGTGDHAGTWSEVAPSFVASHRVVLVDLPGHGDSPPEDGELPMATVVAGVERVLGSQVVGGAAGSPAILVGNSLGAWLATLLAERHPAQVGRLVLVNGGALLGEPGGPSLQPKDRREAERLMNLLRDPAAPPLPGFVLDDVVRRAAAGPIARLGQDAAGLVAHLRSPEQLAAIATPVDLVWGVSDQLVPLAYAERLLRAFPAARLTRVERCGHVPQVECAPALGAALAEVLAAPPPAPRAPAATEAIATEPGPLPVPEAAP
jgi:pimeloyl-ACP methyl ester carboxylesterase